MATSMKPHQVLISSLLKEDLYPHAIDDLQLIETHISWVILTGPFAYKIKKPVDLGFLDFSSLEKRHLFCEEELRLNQRTAPSIYLEVLPITGTAEQPQWAGEGEVIEYAVKMMQFPQAAQLDRMLESNGLTTQHIDAFAHLVAIFHEQISVADTKLAYGDAKHVLHPIEENFNHIRECINNADALQILDVLEEWSLSQYKKLKPLLEQRKQQGFIRECHGDMHLRNLAWIGDKPVAFDCIEFNPNLRWIDVISEIAFLIMDLQDRQQTELAQRFLNTYLEITGDYKGVKLLPFYKVYRALVRAKVDAIRLDQKGLEDKERNSVHKEFIDYLLLAQSYTEQTAQRLIITRGLSGSGKTTLTQSLPEKINAIRIRSDVERKRLAGLKASESGQAKPGKGIYTKSFSDETYQYLAGMAAEIIDAGYSVVVDATFLAGEQRDLFRQLATDKNISFTILDFVAPSEILRQRIKKRTGDASDADLEVLQQQLANLKPLTDNEMPFVITIDTETVKDLYLEYFKSCDKKSVDN